MAETRKPDSGPLGDKTKNASIQPAESTCTFPFKKLPAELQVMVIRFTMPQKGLRFQREDRKYYNATRGKRKWWYSWTRQEDSIPTALFLTNHYLSAIALDTLYREVFMHIGVSNQALSIFDQRMPTDYYPSRVPADKMQYFTSMRCYRLNIRLGEFLSPWYTNYVLSRGGYKFLYSGLKEKLRLISDMLAENPDIQRLTVTFPCCCTRPQAEGVPPIIPITQDYLTILKRLKVSQPVIFIPAHGPDVQAEADLCNKPECLNLAQNFQASMGHLIGEALSNREQTWKNVKAMKRPTGRETRSVHEYFRYLGDFRLQIDDTMDELFEHWTKVAVEGLEKWYEQWELEKVADSANKAKSPE
ncbi:MAG: hypothetical protein L6R38_002974 [Xanthoria sp. 2 TBL-2021]|nr:MAG: hypothetical protein L6R38_002974 [Xanthoria sp. 2 TBL-2021]